MQTTAHFITQPLRVCMLASLLFFGSSCEKTVSTDVNEDPIVRGYTYSGKYIHFNVSHQVPFDTEQTYNLPNVDSLYVVISYDDQSFSIAPAGDGDYIDSNLSIPENVDFSFSFEYNNQKISGTTYIPSKPEITSVSSSKIEVEKIELNSNGIPTGGDPSDQPDPIEIEWENNDGSYYLLVIENIEEDPEAIRELDDDEDEEDRPEFSFRQAPTNASFSEIRGNEFQYFGTHRVILYHVLPDYAALYEDVSTSSQNLTNPSTNLTNAYGIFTGLNSDTTYIEVVED